MGNRTEVTPYMANLLHKIITGVPVCLPSVVMHHIIRIVTGSQPCAAPFGYLMTQLARSYGVIPPESEAPEHTTVFNKTNLILMRLPPPQQVNPIREGDAELEAAEAEAPEAEHVQPQQPQPPPRRSLKQRMSSLEQEVGSLRTEFHEYRKETSGMLKKTLKYLSNISKSCRRHDDTIPPSPTDST